MKNWFFRLFGVCVVGLISFGIYDYYKAGLHTRPPMPDGAFSLSYKSGFRAIILDIEDERSTRRYLVRPRTDVPNWFKESWSYCAPLTEEERVFLLVRLEQGPGMRLDGVCTLDADGDVITTGYLFTVPDI
jgi:hypothetical protein